MYNSLERNNFYCQLTAQEALDRHTARHQNCAAENEIEIQVIFLDLVSN